MTSDNHRSATYLRGMWNEADLTGVCLFMKVPCEEDVNRGL